MIPVVNHGRRTGNPEPGLLRHVLFLVITIPFHLSSVGYSLHCMFVTMTMTITIVYIICTTI